MLSLHCITSGDKNKCIKNAVTIPSVLVIPALTILFKMYDFISFLFFLLTIQVMVAKDASDIEREREVFSSNMEYNNSNVCEGCKEVACGMQKALLTDKL